MKLFRNILNTVKPHFEKGGKLEKMYPAYDAFETFLFVPDHTTKLGSHIRDAIDLKRTMITVLIALMPALLFGMWNVGQLHFTAIGESFTLMSAFTFGALKMLPLIAISYGVGLSIEFAFAISRGHSVNEGYLVTGMLIPMVMPIDIPLWMLAVSVVFAVIIGKEVFGGTGMNILNPALTARAFLFFAYPTYMSGDKVWIHTGEKMTVDGFSGATPLADLAANIPVDMSLISSFFNGTIPGSVGETSTIAIFIGAAILIFTGIGSWRTMLSVFIGGYIMSLLFNLWGVNELMLLPAHLHLILGGFAFGAVFMATDPVTAAQTNKGKYIVGFLIGVFAIIIRVFNPAYPEGMMMAILLLNIFAPLVDHYVIAANIKRRLKRIKT
ncbi:MAG TPA: NADH:ubiquinone reductase (Na(+)-transporting) subunit B [Flavobacteriales bacterium]|jgi:Na+-transporting NADH:ubiquinone oxidoreductase subunit B|nr:NADH:ubiquinone reductase (Na(+)-transporting) subunit B [Flavobacteriales bacterium]